MSSRDTLCAAIGRELDAHDQRTRQMISVGNATTLASGAGCIGLFALGLYHEPRRTHVAYRYYAASVGVLLSGLGVGLWVNQQMEWLSRDHTAWRRMHSRAHAMPSPWTDNYFERMDTLQKDYDYEKWRSGKASHESDS